LYSETIDLISHILQLEKWDWFIDNAVRHLIHREYIYAADRIQERLVAIDWPKSNSELENAIISLMESFVKYINQYLEGSLPRTKGDFFGPDNSFKSIFPNPDYEFYSTKQDLWARKNFLLLCAYTKKLNVYLKKVRQFSNPYYFKIRGKFLIEDNLGTHLGHWGAFIDPADIKDMEIEKEIKRIDIQLKNLEKKK